MELSNENINNLLGIKKEPEKIEDNCNFPPENLKLKTEFSNNTENQNYTSCKLETQENQPDLLPSISDFLFVEIKEKDIKIKKKKSKKKKSKEKKSKKKKSKKKKEKSSDQEESASEFLKFELDEEDNFHHQDNLNLIEFPNKTENQNNTTCSKPEENLSDLASVPDILSGLDEIKEQDVRIKRKYVKKKIKVKKPRIRKEYTYTCEICKARYKKKTLFNYHMKRHRNEYDFVCEFCGNAYESNMRLTAHLLCHTRIRNYPCQICGKLFLSSGNRDRHEKRLHWDIRDYKCEHCPRAFGSGSELKNHIGIHTGVKPYTCEQCGTGYIRRSQLVRHKKAKTPCGEKPFSCERCGEGFRVKSQLKAHKKTITPCVLKIKDSTVSSSGIKNELATKNIESNSNVDQKNINLKQEFPNRENQNYACKLETQKSDLESDSNLHKVEIEDKKKSKCKKVPKPISIKDNTCKICQITYKNRNSYTYHMRRHRNEKDFICKICETYFDTQWKLSRHTLEHTGIKKYICRICEKPFPTWSNRDRHEKRLHGNEVALTNENNK